MWHVYYLYYKKKKTCAPVMQCKRDGCIENRTDGEAAEGGSSREGQTPRVQGEQKPGICVCEDLI